MRKLFAILIWVWTCAVSFQVQSQQASRLNLRNGSWELNPNLNTWAIGRPFPQEMVFEGKLYGLLHFKELPTEQIHNQLQADGIALTSYLPANTYLAIIPFGVWNAERLSGFGADGFYPMAPSMKLAPDLAQGTVPEYSRRAVNKVALDVKLWQPQLAEANKGVFLRNGRSIEKDFGFGGLFRVVTTLEDALALAALPFIDVVEFCSPPDEFNNLTGKNNHRANILGSSLTGNRNLQGTGVVVGIGDGGFVAPHLDFQGRLIQTNSSIISSFGDHGDHVSGTVGGAGIINPENMGMAPECLLVTAQASDIISITPSMYAQYGMVITNNSYGNQFNCATVGVYNSLSNAIDQQILDYPAVMHVFAAANSGGQTCTPLPAGYRTVAPGLNIGKNITTVANVSDVDVISGSSSRGPTVDGRVKPEISATGGNVVSTIPTNTYGTKSGTSMASPGYAGTLAQLTQRFRQLNNNTNPDQALLKALTCNTSDDVGNANVDYIYGFGRVNGRRAVEALEGGRYLQSNVGQGVTNTHLLSIPAGVARVKVMLYWSDRPGNPSSFKSLVNDLDLQLVDPNNNTFLPWVLNPATDSWTNAATRRVDTTNNIEQVTIDNPTAGNFNIRVVGSKIATVSQSYFITWELMTVTQTKLTFPLGGERLVAGSAYQIRWDAFPGTGGTWTVDLSTDNGANWSNIASNINTFTRNRSWTPGSSVFTNQARIRVTNTSGTAGTSSSEASFTIAPIPVLSSTVCDKTATVSWTALSGAASYDVFILRNNNWVQVGNTSSSSFVFSGLQNGQTYWSTVRARSASGAIGRNALAISFTPTANTACTGSSDIGVYDIITTKVGIQFTSTAYSINQQITVRLRNFGAAAVNQTVPVRYRINGGTVFTDMVTLNLASATTGTNLTLSNGFNLSAPGTYTLDVWTDWTSDLRPGNDTLHADLISVANLPVSLPVAENFSGVGDLTILDGFNQICLGFISALDDASTGYRIRTNFLGTVAPSFGRALTLDKASDGGSSVFNQVIWTLNLSNLANNADPRLDFDFVSHNEVNSANDKIWVRGSDTQPWVVLYDLGANLGTAGATNQVRALSIKNVLGNQPITSSFQIRIGQENNRSALGLAFNGGISFDNFRLYDPGQDLRLAAVVSPISNCGLSSAASVTISIQNLSATAATNIPVFYRLNQGSWVQGTMSNLAAGATANFTFPQTVNLGTPGNYTFSFRVANPTDLNPLNDSLLNVQVTSIQTIASFPYLETFENSDGQFRAGGTNSTWQWGAPSNGTKMNIRTAGGGSRCWVTNLNGQYQNLEVSYIESPCFNMSSLAANPTVSFRNIMYVENTYDFVWVDYSTDGTTWTRLGVNNQGTNWYNSASPLGWTGNFTSWRTSSFTFPLLSIASNSRSSIRFRIVLSADNTITDDGVGIDDFSIALPAAATISTGAITGNNFIVTETISVPFSVTGTFNAGNVFTAQLSDTNRSFTNATNIGSLTATSSGTISATIPANALNGTRYRIRVVASNPSIQGTDNGSNITLINPSTYPVPPITLSGGAIGCVGDTVTATIATLPRATGPYTWVLPNFTSGVGNLTTNTIRFVVIGTGTGTIRRASLASQVANQNYPNADFSPYTGQQPSSLTISSNTPVQAGQSLNLSAQFVAGATYLWSGPNGFTSNSRTPTITNVTSANQGTYTLRTVVGACTSQISTHAVSVNTTAPNLTVSGQQTISGNYTQITINNGATATLNGNLIVDGSMVVQSGGTLVLSTHLITGGGSFTLMPGAILHIGNAQGISASGNSGGIQVTGTRTYASNARYIYYRNASQTGTGLPATVSQLVIQVGTGTVTLTQSNLLITGSLTLNSGNFIATGKVVTLESNAAGTGRLGRVNDSATYVGDLEVKRFISGASPRWVMGSIPTQGQTLLTLRNSLPISGPFSGASQFTQRASIWFYNPSTLTDNGFMQATSLNNNLNVGRGFRAWLFPAFLQGNRTWATSGAPQVGTTNIPLQYCASGCGYGSSNGWNMIGNPYPSPIDFQSVSLSGTSTTFYTWNGDRYAAYNRTTQIGTNGQNRYIASGQGFFIEALGSGASIQFNETDKPASDGTPDAFLRTAQRPAMIVKLSGTGASDDEFVLNFTHQATKGYDHHWDSHKFVTEAHSISALVANEKLAIDSRPINALGDTIQLQLHAPQMGTYQLNFEGLVSPQGQSWFLIDAYTQIIEPIVAGLQYSFVVTNHPGSSDANRFSLMALPLQNTGTQIQLRAQLNLWPNPAQTELYVSEVANTKQWTITDALGRVLMGESSALSQEKLAIGQLPKGVFTLTLMLTDGSKLRKSFVKE